MAPTATKVTPKETSVTSVPSPIEPTQPQNYNGIHLNYEYNVNIPLWVFDERWWTAEGGGRKPSTDVMRVYAWLLDKVTRCVVEDGVTVGLVLGGKELSHLDIGSTFGISWSGVQRATAYLVKVKLISRVQNTRTKEYSYAVLHCRKFEAEQAGYTTITVRGKKVKGIAKPQVIDGGELDFLDDDELDGYTKVNAPAAKAEAYCDPTDYDELF